MSDRPTGSTPEEKERWFREREQREGNGVDRSSKESFPASDPPAIPDPGDREATPRD